VTPLFVFDAGAVASTGGMPADQVLDLGQEDVFAARGDHLVVAAATQAALGHHHQFHQGR
jgi:hypothetical protein